MTKTRKDFLGGFCGAVIFSGFIGLIVWALLSSGLPGEM